MAGTDQLAPELRTLVKVSVAWLGRVISRAAGEEQFIRIEKIPQQNGRPAGSPWDRPASKHSSRFSQNSGRCLPEQRREIARAFTLMLELMNACEAAYRSYRLRRRPPVSGIRDRIRGNHIRADCAPHRGPQP